MRKDINKIVAGDPEAYSADVVAENLAHLKTLFPEAFAEGNIDFTVLKQLLGDAVDDGDEKYGLNWHGKRRARQLALMPSTGTLRPCPEDSVDWDTTQNLMIEGDNLEVLKLLQKSYAGKVKLIYIDPPYNTGKDFVYRDNYKDGIKNYLEITGQLDGDGDKLCSNTDASGRFHTNWLNMIYPRLKLAHVLLQQNGFLFMTVDDVEVHHLRQIADEIFGEENFVANVVWEKKYTRSNDAQLFSDNHDHILIFAKNRSDSKLSLQGRTVEQEKAYRNPDNHPKGPWKSTPLSAKSGGNSRPYTFMNGVTWAPSPGTYRRFSDKTMREMDEGNEIWFGSDGLATPSRKTFLSEAKSGVSPVTIWPYKEVGHNHEANNELRQLLAQGVFSNPKPTRLIHRIIELATGSPDDSCIVLDFFAGSGTTGHAVMKYNSEDGGCRRYILVQFPETVNCENREQKTAAAYLTELGKPLNIAEITKERLRKAPSEFDSSTNALDTGFRVFKLDTSNIRAWEPNHDNLEATLLENVEHIKAGRSEQDLLYELLLKLGFDLCAPIETRTIAGKSVHSIGAGALLACLDKRIAGEDIDPLAVGIAEWHSKSSASDIDTTIVFRDGAFYDDVAKANLIAILEQSGLGNIRSL